MSVFGNRVPESVGRDVNLCCGINNRPGSEDPSVRTGEYELDQKYTGGQDHEVP